jgi:hypothetical protein
VQLLEKFKYTILFSGFFILTILSLVDGTVAVDPWKILQPGLNLGIFDAPLESKQGDSRIYVLKIDPQFFEINLYCYSEFKDKQRTLPQWAEDFQLKAVINGGMFAKDLSTSVGYLKSGNHLNNPGLHPKYNAILACNPLSKNVPPFKIIDRTCEDLALWHDQYQSFLQSYRMISCRQKNVWQPQEQSWSIAALGIDHSGNLLLIYSRSSYPVHDFIEMLLKLPLNIQSAMYLEGGIQSGLFLSNSKDSLNNSKISYPESESTQNGNNHFVIPNVIGVKEIKPKKQ